ncbi:unnamed protein product, partial [Nezara viridula]
MRILTTLVHDNTCELEECSIDALENLKTLGEAVDEVYGPLLLMVTISSVPRIVMDSYAVLMQLFDYNLHVNIISDVQVNQPQLVLPKMGLVYKHCKKRRPSLRSKSVDCSGSGRLRCCR